MHSQLLFLLTLLMGFLCVTIQETTCGCLNGGTCASLKTQLRCKCPSGFISHQCQLPAKEITTQPHSATLTSKYTYFYFLPEEVNYYKLMFTICLLSNPSKKHTLFYIQTQKNDGSLRQVPSLFQTAKIVLEQQTCTTFSTHYISIKRKEDQSFRKIVVGLKIMQFQEADKYLNTYFNHQQNLKLSDVAKQPERVYEIQQITIKMNYEVYLRTSYYGTFVILFTAFVLLLILISLVTFLKKKYSLDNVDVDALRFTSFDLHYLARSMHRNRRRYSANPQQRYRLRHKITISNLQLFMPVTHHQSSQSMFGEQYSKEQEVCSICLLQFKNGEETRRTPCNHLYHRDCIDSWWESNMSCPMCRRNLDFSHQMRQFYANYLRNQLNEQ